MRVQPDVARVCWSEGRIARQKTNESPNKTLLVLSHIKNTKLKNTHTGSGVWAIFNQKYYCENDGRTISQDQQSLHDFSAPNFLCLVEAKLGWTLSLKKILDCIFEYIY